MAIVRTTFWITLIEITATLLLISLTFYISQPVKSTKTLFIPQGSISTIITHLRQKGYDLTPIDRHLLRLIGTPQSGWINVGKTEMNRLEFLHTLTTAKAALQKVTLIPGETKPLFFRQLAEALSLDPIELSINYHRLSPYPEAGIYADTYHVPLGIDEAGLIGFLVERTESRYGKLSRELLGQYDREVWLRYLTIASIIQKEAANTEEMPLVASVIYNRLAKQMPLQMDGTLNYGVYSHQKVTPQRIREDNSTFNTYKHKGLPASPIGAVGKNAILAALKPAKTDYLYFVINRKGTHSFTHSYRIHRENIAQMP